MNENFKKKIEMLQTKIEANLKLIPELKRQNKDYKDIIDVIWELSKERFVLQNRSNRQSKSYKGLIFTVGLTPEPIILNILANKPEAIYFIHTEESEKYLDKIIEETNIKPSQFKRGLMPKDSVISAFRLIKKGLYFLCEEKGIEKEMIAVDPTGGTKIMSVGCGLATFIMDLDLLYVSNENYNELLRRPEPGSEKLVNLSNLNTILLGDKLLEDIHISPNKIEKISKYFKDITSTHVVLLSIKSGELLSDIRYLESHNLNGDIFAGFITAITTIGQEISNQIGLNPADLNSPELEINHKGYKITVINGEFARLSIISDKKIGELMKKKAFQLLDEYEEIHMIDLRNFRGNLGSFRDFPLKTKEKLDLNLNERLELNYDQLYQYDKNPSLIYVLKTWYNEMIFETNLSSFYPVLLPKIFMRELGMTKDEANYWTYDLFEKNLLIH